MRRGKDSHPEGAITHILLPLDGQDLDDGEPPVFFLFAAAMHGQQDTLQFPQNSLKI